MLRALLCILVWLVFAAAVTYYQDHDSGRAGEHPESDAGPAASRAGRAGVQRCGVTLRGTIGAMRGWRPDGTGVELSGRQEAEVYALLSDPSEAWVTVLHTVMRLDGVRRGVPADDPVWDALARAAESPAAKLRCACGCGEILTAGDGR